MSGKPVFAATIALTFIMTGPSFAPPPSDISSLFPDDAWEKSCDAIKQLYDPAELREYRIYVLPETVGGGYVVEVPYAEPLSGPDVESWLFFVDEIPPANWGHPCRVVFVTTDAYDKVQYECQFPPENFGEFLDVTKKVLDLLYE